MTATTDEQRLATPPREMRRESPFALIRAESDDEPGDGLTLDGYAAVFNRGTIIDSWEGRFREKIAPGAMKKSFRESPPRVQFDHGSHPLIGSIPIGAIETVREESDPTLAPDGGAHVIARLHDNWLIQPVRDAIASESIDGMSFRFSVVREEWHEADGKKVTDDEKLRDLLRRSWLEDVPDDELLVRTLKELRVPELGPVVWPAYTDTTVGVRSQTLTIDLGRLDDPVQKNRLAQAVLMADRAEADAEAPLVTEESVTDVPADEHPEESNDTPQTTAPADDAEAAGEHKSVTTRSAVQVGVLERLRAVRHSLTDAQAAESRYSS